LDCSPFQVIPAIPENLWETYKDARRMEVDAQMKVLHLEVAVQNATQRQMYECEVEMATLRHESEQISRTIRCNCNIMCEHPFPVRKEHDFFQNQLEFKTPGDISKDGTKVSKILVIRPSIEYNFSLNDATKNIIL